MFEMNQIVEEQASLLFHDNNKKEGAILCFLTFK